MNFWQLSTIVLLSILTKLQYSLPAPLIPLEMKRRLIGQVSIGVTIASYSIGVILGSLVPTDGLYSSFGRRKTLQFSLLMLSFSLVLYGVSYFIPDEWPDFFLGASITARIF